MLHLLNGIHRRRAYGRMASASHHVPRVKYNSGIPAHGTDWPGQHTVPRKVVRGIEGCAAREKSARQHVPQRLAITGDCHGSAGLHGWCGTTISGSRGHGHEFRPIEPNGTFTNPLTADNRARLAAAEGNGGFGFFCTGFDKVRVAGSGEPV